jgi:hypothetical protein
MMNWKRFSDAGTQDFGLKLHDPRLADALVAGGYQARCGYGTRQPVLLVSPWAKQN